MVSYLARINKPRVLYKEGLYKNCLASPAGECETVFGGSRSAKGAAKFLWDKDIGALWDWTD